MRKFSTKLTARGSLCLVITIAFTSVGIFLGDGVLITLGLSALTLMLCCYVLGRSNLYNLEVDVSLPHKCHANKRYKPNVVIQNKRSLLDAFNIRLQVHFPHDAVLRSFAGWVPASSISCADIFISVPMRASSVEHAYRLSSSFPLGLFSFLSRQSLHQPLTIYPRSIIPKELLEDGVAGQSYEPSEQSSIQYSGEPRSIRPWQPGDAAKSIHWPASIRSMAQGYSLRVREYDPPGLVPIEAVVIFHSFSAQREMMREDAFERAISLTVGTISYLRNLNIKATLLADFMCWNPIYTKRRSQYYECLSILADCKRAVGTELHELQSALDGVPDAQQIIIISDMPSEAMRDLVQIPEAANVVDIEQVYFAIKKTLSAKEVLSISA